MRLKTIEKSLPVAISILGIILVANVVSPIIASNIVSQNESAKVENITEVTDREVEVTTDQGETIDIPTMVMSTQNLITAVIGIILSLLSLAAWIIKRFGDRFLTKQQQERTLLAIQEGITGLNKAKEEKALTAFALTQLYETLPEGARKQDVKDKIDNVKVQIQKTDEQIKYYLGEAERLFPEGTGRLANPNTLTKLPREASNVANEELIPKYRKEGIDSNV